MDWSRNAYDGFYAVGLGLPDGFAHKFVHIYRAVYKSNNQSRTFKIHWNHLIQVELLEPTLLHQNQWTKDSFSSFLPPKSGTRTPPRLYKYARYARYAHPLLPASSLATKVPKKTQKLKKKRRVWSSERQRRGLDNDGVICEQKGPSTFASCFPHVKCSTVRR